MTTANILRLPPHKKLRAPRAAQSRGHRRRLRRQRTAAGAVAAVAIVLTGLSLSHLAHGIALVTNAPAIEAWAMAVGIDLGFIALELGQLCAATPAVRREVEQFTRPAIIGTLAASALMNGMAFGYAAQGNMVYFAAALGIAIPAMIYALSRVTFGLAVSR
jgi:hypothetical protein